MKKLGLNMKFNDNKSFVSDIAGNEYLYGEDFYNVKSDKKIDEITANINEASIGVVACDFIDSDIVELIYKQNIKKLKKDK